MSITPQSLLLRLRNPQDRSAWDEFVQLYSPIIFNYSLRTKLDRNDCDDLMQEVFVVLFKRMPHFEYRHTGSFRGYLQKIVSNQHKQILRRKPNHYLEHDVLDQVDVNQDFWDQEYNEMLFKSAMTLMKAIFEERTWKSFYLTTVEGRPVAEVTRELGMTPAAVYAAKLRIITKLRQLLGGFYE